MASLLALRALLGAGLGLGALDLVWINVAIAPRLVEHEPTARIAANPPPVVTPIEEPAPAPAAQATPEQPAIKRVYFATDSAQLEGRSRRALAELVADAGSTAQFVLEGHADYRGTEALNETLSKDRAITVQHELVRLGIERARIRLAYAGEAQPSSELWRDRRVDIQILGGTR